MARMGRSISTRARTVSRVLSAPVVGFYFWVGVAGGNEAFLRTFAFFLLPVLMVWFPDLMARATGRFGVVEVVRRASPPWAVLAMGWALLLIPVWLPFVVRLFGGEALR